MLLTIDKQLSLICLHHAVLKLMVFVLSEFTFCTHCLFRSQLTSLTNSSWCLCDVLKLSLLTVYKYGQHTKQHTKNKQAQLKLKIHIHRRISLLIQSSVTMSCHNGQQICLRQY